MILNFRDCASYEGLMNRSADSFLLFFAILNLPLTSLYAQL